jgi:broad specificity phosphatase PhoE
MFFVKELDYANHLRHYQRRPKRIVCVRHGQALGNLDEKAFRDWPDPEIPLSEKGVEQAKKVGEKLKSIIGEESVRFYISPYARSRSTHEYIMRSFDSNKCIVSEDSRIREQDFGNFQDPTKMALCKVQRKLFGRFYYRFPNGESGADVYDRVCLFFDTFFANMASTDFGENVVIVSHGLTIRLLLMRFFHWYT